MSENPIGFWAAVWRFISFYKARKALGLARAADEQFTGSAQGISDAFDIQQDNLVRQFQQYREAVAEIEAQAEEKRQLLENLNREESDLLKKREGALAQAERAKETKDEDGYAKHAAAFERFQTRIDEIEALQARTETEIADLGKAMKKHMLQLTSMQAEVARLPQEKAQAIADFVSASAIIKLNDRLQNMQTSLDRGPLDAVLQANRKLTAKARISEKLAGTDVRVQDAEYAQEGKTATAREKLDSLLAARKAEKAAKTGEAPVADTTAERPKI